MILNLNTYRNTLNSLKPMMLKAMNDNKIEDIPKISLHSHVPLVAVLSYALRSDVIGKNSELKHTLDEAIKFYKYEDIVPWDDL